jgi:non-heme chloroperoxidase
MVTFAIAPLAPVISLGQVTLPGGVRLQYRRQGPQRGPAMILLHGYSDSSLSFTRIMPLLPLEWRVIALDLRGHGDSDKPAQGYRMPDMADDVLHLMDALDIRSAVVVGHSMGSFVAQALVERAPQRVSNLVLVGSAATPVNNTLTGLRPVVDALTDPIDATFAREFQYSTIALPVPEPFMDAAIVNSRRMPAAIWKKVIAGMLVFQPVLPRADVGALVLGGTRDAVFSVGEQKALARQFPRAQLRLFEGVGHALHWEQPDVFARELMHFAR